LSSSCSSLYVCLLIRSGTMQAGLVSMPFPKHSVLAACIMQKEQFVLCPWGSWLPSHFKDRKKSASFSLSSLTAASKAATFVLLAFPPVSSAAATLREFFYFCLLNLLNATSISSLSKVGLLSLLVAIALSVTRILPRMSGRVCSLMSSCR
jgi:hypothetical protein